MSENGKEIDEIIKKFPTDLIVIILLFILFVFGIKWKSPTLLLTTFLITLIIVWGGYANTITLGKQILKNRLEQLGAKKGSLDKAFKDDISTSDSTEKVEYVPTDTRQKVEFRTSSISNPSLTPVVITFEIATC